MMRLAWLLVLLLFTAAGQAQAACANPTGTSGEMVWDSTDGRLEFCDGTNWYGLLGTTTAASCPTAQAYTVSNSLPAYCNASNKVVLATLSTPIGGCSTAGQVTWNSVSTTLQYCDGTKWNRWCTGNTGETVAYAYGPAYAWGDGDSYQLGIGSLVSDSDVTQVVSTTAISFTQVAAGSAHSCGVDADGKAYCWGSNSSGRLGIGNLPAQPWPVQVVSATAISYTQVAAGNTHTCAVDRNNRAYCWGSASLGELGYGATTTQQYLPMRVTSGTAISYTQVTAGSSFSCGVDAIGRAYCWGSGTNGKLGYGASAATQAYPMRVSSATTISYTQIAAGTGNACAVDSNNRAYCWGIGSSGQLGYGGTASSQAWPMRVTSATNISYTQVDVGTNFSCGVDLNNNAYCWGLGTSGEMGNGDSSSQSWPVKVVSTTAISFTSVAAGNGFACGLDRNAKLYCWGDPSAGGMGTAMVSAGTQTYPVRIDTAGQSFSNIDINGNGSHGMASQNTMVGCTLPQWRITFTSITGGADGTVFLSEIGWSKNGVETTPSSISGTGGAAVGTLGNLLDNDINTMSSGQTKTPVPQTILSEFTTCQSFNRLTLNALGGGGYTGRTFNGSVEYSLDAGSTWTTVYTLSSVTLATNGSDTNLDWTTPFICP